MANPWLEKLKAYKTTHNTHTTITREGTREVKTPDTPEKALDKVDTNIKKTKKKLTPGEVYERTFELASEWSGYVIDDVRAQECLKWAKQVDEVEIDIETYGRLKRDGLLYTRAMVRLIILHHEDHMWFIDCNYVSDEMVTEILEALETTHKIFHNALFDVPRLYRRFGVLLDYDVDDTMIASRVARAGEWIIKKHVPVQTSHSLDDLIERELSLEIPKDKNLKWGGLLTEEHLTYAGDDVYHLFDLFGALENELNQRELTSRYEAIRDRLPDFIGAAVRGIPLDAERLQPILDSLESEKTDLRARLGELAPPHPEGAEWTWNTNKHEPEKGEKSRGRNGALRALSLLGVEISDLQDQTLLDHRENHEVIGVLYNYRKKSNTLSRYRKWIPDFYDEGTGRLHPQPKVAAAVTGRVLYSDPNAQGIDKKKTDEFRKVVRAPSEAGRAIVTGDFAQQELRIAAYFSEDRAMLNAFKDGRDIYQETAKALVGREVSKDDPARAAAKRATLGFLYGLGVDKYRTNVYKDTQEKLSGEQAVKDRQAFRAAFPTFYNWQRRYGSRPEWFTRSVLGWRRYVSPSRDKRTGGLVPKYTERLNGPIQSTAGDILYLTLQKMGEDPRPDTHFLLSVHDELVLECPEDDAREVALWLKEKMRSSIEDVLGRDLGGEKSVEVSYGPSWGETTEEV